MTILQEIHAWSKGLPPGNKTPSLASTRADLSAEAVGDLYALAKTEAGIEDETPTQHSTMRRWRPPSDPARLVQLLAIKRLANVNALASRRPPNRRSWLDGNLWREWCRQVGILANPQARLPCTRSARSHPSPDAKMDPAKAGKPSAKFDVAIVGKSELTWTVGSTPPEPLSEIAIFDTHCARAYISTIMATLPIILMVWTYWKFWWGSAGSCESWLRKRRQLIRLPMQHTQPLPRSRHRRDGLFSAHSWRNKSSRH